MINLLDGWLYGSYPVDTPGLNHYWENAYHHEDSITKTSDVFRTFVQAFARVGAKRLKTSSGSESQNCGAATVSNIKEVTLLNHHDQLAGVLVLFDMEHSASGGGKQVVTLESWLAPVSHEELLNLNMSDGPQRLVGLEV